MSTQSIALNLERADTYGLRATAYHHQGRYSQALEDYTRALDLDPHDGRFFYGRAATYYVQERFQRAVNDYTPAIGSGGNAPAAHYWRGLAYYTMNSFSNAINDFEFFVQAGKHDRSIEATDAIKREAWIRALQTGTDRFDSETLQQLLKD